MIQENLNKVKIIIGEKVNLEGYTGLALAYMKRYNTAEQDHRKIEN